MPGRHDLTPAQENAADWRKLAGLVCDCPVGCTDERWGDAGTCSSTCRPCAIMRGRIYKAPA